jgi:hypothetical protein
MACLSATYSAIACWPSRNRSSFFFKAIAPGVSGEFVLNFQTPFGAGADSSKTALVDLGQVVEPLVVRDNALQCSITGIGVRLAAMEAGHRPRSDA